MRYQRIRYRYAIVMTRNEPRPLGHTSDIDRFGVVLAQPCWRPPADIIETASQIIVRADLAGVDEDVLDVVLYEDAVIIEGHRRLPHSWPEAIYHQAEIRQGPFRLELVLPALVDIEAAQAHYDRGLLELTLPRD